MTPLFYGYCSLLTAFSIPSISMAAVFFFLVTLLFKVYPEMFLFKEKTRSDKSDGYRLYKSIVSLMDESQYFLKKGISLDDVAIELMSNRTYVSNCINFYSGKSFSDFINYYRIEYAKALLVMYNGKTNIAEVAENCGFDSDSTFIRNFKKITGVPPITWKKNNSAEKAMIYSN